MIFRRIKRKTVLMLVNHVFAGTRFFEIKRRLLNSIGYKIGKNTKVVGPVCNTGHLEIGENCWVGKNLVVHGNGWVTIGDCCDIAPETVFLTGGHKIGSSVRRAGEGEHYNIRVGNGTWIGARATVLGNVSIGEGCVIAACACVHTDIPEHTVAGGVPAAVIKELKHGD